MNKNKTVLITGANGFIGSHILHKFLQENHKVIAFIRETADISFMDINGVKIIRGDITDPDTLIRAMQDVDTVVHVAALARDWGNYSEFYNINVTGTQNVLKAAKINDIKQFIFISSTAVLGEEDCSTAKKEDSPYKPEMKYILNAFIPSAMNHYRKTKMLAEQECINFCKNEDISLTVIRPTWVYGPGEFHAGPYEFCSTVMDGVPLFPMGLNNRFHVIYVKDLANAVYSSFEKKLSGINIFNIGNQEAPNIREYFNLFCKHLNVRPPYYLPLFVAYPAGILLEIISIVLKLKEPLLLTGARVKMFYCNNIYDTTRAETMLSFKNQYSLDEGIKETVDWWIQHGFLTEKKANKLKQNTETGLKRKFLDIRMSVTIALHYFLQLLTGKISTKQYYYFIKRMLLFTDLLKKI